MRLFFYLAILNAIASNCIAQADFRFYVLDKTETKKLNFEFVQDITIYDLDSQEPRLVYYTEYRVYGVNQDRFSSTTERYSGNVSEKDYEAFLDTIRKLPTKELFGNKNDSRPSSSGWIGLDGHDHKVSAAPDANVRKQWQTVLNNFLKKQAPEARREKSTQTLEGETVKPEAVEFKTLLKTPEVFDGKRIRISGFYHDEFEGSSFATSKNNIRNYKQALWLGEASAFADSKHFKNVNDQFITVEGTFQIGPAGHMGLWMGEIVRLTSSLPTSSKGQAEEGAAATP